MKVIFDSNVWQHVVAPDDYKLDPDYLIFCGINAAIRKKIITPYISETIFTLEAVRNADRKKVFSERTIESEGSDGFKDGRIERKVLLTSNTVLNLDDNFKLKNYLKLAGELGFNIIPIGRLGKIVNEDLVNHHNPTAHWHSHDSFMNYMEEIVEILDFIDSIGSGKSQLDDLLKEYGTNSIEGIKKAPETLDRKIQKAIAEWADGDTVAICIALKCDYLCTRDEGKSAGKKSVFSFMNQQLLKRKYNFRTIMPQQLGELVIL